MFVNEYGYAINIPQLLHPICNNSITHEALLDAGIEFLYQFMPNINQESLQHYAVIYNALRYTTYWTHIYVSNHTLFLCLNEAYLSYVDIDRMLLLIQNPADIQIPADGNELMNPISITDLMATITYSCAILLMMDGVALEDTRMEWMISDEWNTALTETLSNYYPTGRVFSIAISKVNAHEY